MTVEDARRLSARRKALSAGSCCIFLQFLLRKHACCNGLLCVSASFLTVCSRRKAFCNGSYFVRTCFNCLLSSNTSFLTVCLRRTAVSNGYCCVATFFLTVCSQRNAFLNSVCAHDGRTCCSHSTWNSVHSWNLHQTMAQQLFCMEQQ